MARIHAIFVLCVFFVSCVSFGHVHSDDHHEPKVHIVYMGALPRTEQTPAALYAKILQEVGVSPQAVIRRYTRSFAGFAAHITDKQQQALAAHDEVISVFPSQTVELLTTESWDFMGFPTNVSRDRASESDIIVGILDTGIWPESDSFNDRGLSNPPKKWKGSCKGGKNFTCNNKVIGARSYVRDESPRDTVGHGTHTASTAAGVEVQKASFYGIAEGIARGAVPSARLAIYKVCSAGCTDDAILAAFDDAIADGVDILTLSLGSSYPRDLGSDSIALGSLHAMAKGILTVHSAGNSGDNAGTTSSVAPWLFSVAASTTSRQIVNKVQLGNGKEHYGNTVNSFSLNNTKFPLVYGKDASNLNCSDDANTKSCTCLEDEKVKGKIVICNNLEGVSKVTRTGAIGSILHNDHNDEVSRIVPIPTSALRLQDFELLESYYNSNKNPEASISKSELIENKTAPVIATFSSRGPNAIVPDILKPDIAAPGVDILAAFSPVASPSRHDSDKRSVPFSVLSGTSMSCPHVTGAAAYVKSKHPDWSPSAVKSAIMTSASRMNASQSTEGGNREFAFGAGFLNPMKAVNPGLVYETSKMDYVKLLCGIDFDRATLRKIFGDNTTCPKEKSTPKELNYPSMAAKLVKLDTFSVKFPRTVTNVGQANSTYKATVSQIPECNITVEPNVLSFKELNEKQSFVVTISGKSSDKMISASLEWSDGSNVVRSPIVLYK